MCYCSYIHQNVSLRFLTCEPNLNKQPHYVDEADLFYQDPTNWLQKRYRDKPAIELPTHIVMFNVLQPQISEFLEQAGYFNCAKLFHSHFPEGRVGSYVVVVCKIAWSYPNYGKRQPRLHNVDEQNLTVMLPGKKAIKM